MNGYELGTVNVVSHMEGTVIGNVFAGGIIGVAIDSAGGSGYDYPQAIRVVMGEERTISTNNSSGN